MNPEDTQSIRARPARGAGPCAVETHSPIGGVPFRLVLVGFGHVGRALARRIAEDQRARGRRSAWSVVAILDSRSCVADPDGLDLPRVLRAKESTGRLGGTRLRAWDLAETLRRIPCDVVVEMSVSDLTEGQPGTRHLLSALESGVDAVTSNKGPFALHYRAIAEAVRRNDRQVRFGTTVGGPIPILEMLVDHLAPGEVERVRGIPNGTTQFVLDRVARGASFAGAVREAQRLGFAEADPSRDLDGWDAAWKAAIIHNCLFSPPIEVNGIHRDVVDASVIPRVRRAMRAGKKLVALADVRPGRASVRLVEVPSDSPWAVEGASNAFEVQTRRSGRLILQGPGAGPEETAGGIYADLGSLQTHRFEDGRCRGTIRWPPLPSSRPRRASAPKTAPRAPPRRRART